MRVIELSAMTNGAHRNQNADFDITPLDGWAIVSEGLETPSTFPFVG